MKHENLNNQETTQLGIGDVSNRYLSAEKAKQMTIEALKEIAAKEYDTKCVLEQIEETVQNGAFQIETYYNEKVRDNLVLLGYDCSESFSSCTDTYMMVSWS